MNANVTKTPYYKERVEKIEKEILAITNNATYTVFSGDDAAYLLTLLNDRKWLLDAMFVVTPEEFARMNEVNERLRELTHELHHQVADAHEKAKRAFLGKEFELKLRIEELKKSLEKAKVEAAQQAAADAFYTTEQINKEHRALLEQRWALEE